MMAYIARLLSEASADAPLPKDLARACREYFAPLQVFELHADAFPRDEGETLMAYCARLLDDATADAPLPKDLARACRQLDPVRRQKISNSTSRVEFIPIVASTRPRDPRAVA